MLHGARTVFLAIAYVAQAKPDDHLGAIRQGAMELRTETSRLRCSYSETVIPSEYLVDLRASAQKRPRAQIEALLRGDHQATFEERSSGAFRFDLTRVNGQGIKQRRVYIFDGAEHWSLNYTYSDGEEPPPTVGMKEDMRPRYEAEIPFRRCLGFSVLPVQGADLKTIHDAIVANSSCRHIDDEKVGDLDCCVLSWRVVGPLNLRETVWVARDRGVLVKQYTKELLTAEESRGQIIETWSTESAGSSSVGGHGKDRLLWYPKEITIRTFDRKHNPYFVTRIEVDRLEVNEAVPMSNLAPKLEDGTTVVDRARGGSFVYGNGPSPRVRAMITRGVNKTREKLAAQPTVPTTATMSPPSGLASILPVGALVCGSGGLILAISLVLRRRFSSVSIRQQGESK